ncbi:hypothetical protein TWF696_006631 [Orbilia brochopaga]|uniref:CFEM domain-containing protein n=1 Tax=Orbilia brochopaga TaxID=3140254 RepID=A0AAV9UVN9_9PEZI
MKLIATVVVFGTIAAVSGQDISLPECAEPCIMEGLGSSNCATTDYACQCSDTKALDAILACVQDSCGPSQIPGLSSPLYPLALLAVIAAASAICAEFGGPVATDTSSPDVATVTSTVVSEVTARVTSAANMTSDSKMTTTSTRMMSGTTTQQTPTTTGTQNAAFKMTIGGGFGAVAALVGLLAGL